MIKVTEKVWDIHEGLKNRFLFNNDFNSIYILLTLYDLEENISNICPRYYSTRVLRKKIKNILKNTNNPEFIAHNITSTIHEDVNRIELCFYLEGYKYGFFNNKWVNILEEKALEIYGLDGIYKSKYLFHYDFGCKDIKEIYNNFRREVDFKEKRERYIEELVYTFCNKVIKKKVRNINDYIDKQLKLNFDLYNYSIKEENYTLSEEEQDKIYYTIVNVLIKNLKEIYKDAAWYAINDKVLKRYL